MSQVLLQGDFLIIYNYIGTFFLVLLWKDFDTFPEPFLLSLSLFVWKYASDESLHIFICKKYLCVKS